MFSRLSKDLLFRSPTYIDHGGKLFTVSPTVVAPTALKGLLQRGYELVEVVYIKENEMPHGFRKLSYACVLRNRTILVGVVGLLCNFPSLLSLVSS
jgi:hypothetical protein